MSRTPGRQTESTQRKAEREFDIAIVRIGYAFKTIRVKAPTRAEAEHLALATAGNHEFSESDVEYEVQGGRTTRKRR